MMSNNLLVFLTLMSIALTEKLVGCTNRKMLLAIEKKNNLITEKSKDVYKESFSVIEDAPENTEHSVRLKSDLSGLATIPHSDNYVTQSSIARLAGISSKKRRRTTQEDNPFKKFSTLGTAPPRNRGRGSLKYVMIVDSQGRMTKITDTLRQTTSSSNLKTGQ